MKMKRLISCICAVCMTGCIAPYNSSISLNFISKVSAADSSNEVKFTAIAADSSNDVNFTAIG